MKKEFKKLEADNCEEEKDVGKMIEQMQGVWDAAMNGGTCHLEQYIETQQEMQELNELYGMIYALDEPELALIQVVNVLEHLYYAAPGLMSELKHVLRERRILELAAKVHVA